MKFISWTHSSFVLFRAFRVRKEENQFSVDGYYFLEHEKHKKLNLLFHGLYL